ncbi:Fis family transcriptional regulator [Cryobacterium sp. MLB-32]|uniref:winged helix-turn-helix domain-containing protein n=1 Tax=Cryobacterium sp. MLB-32 TaxID=1529318 RepID=UPI0004E64502|nr:response regulator transcription factor [Cryobacterium sp. MLB-32]KFF60807.1 Fis family transcriptional regulator [Cryobacterium sp. MLB-32]
MKILIVENDPQLFRALRITLGARGYDLITAHDGASALDAAIAENPDLIMLDLGTPQLSGMEVIVALRGWTQIPILVLSGRAGAADKILALKSGADDYVSKPFSIDDLLARIRALTRRVPSEADGPIVMIGNLAVDLSARRIACAGQDPDEVIRLTPTEWRILSLLLRNPGRLVTRERLLTDVWGPHDTSDSGFLRIYVAQLRKKLEPEPTRPRYLLTEAGVGYRFRPDPFVPPTLETLA